MHLSFEKSGARNRPRQQQAQKSRDEAVSERDVAVVKCPGRRHVAVVECRKLCAVYPDSGTAATAFVGSGSEPRGHRSLKDGCSSRLRATRLDRKKDGTGGAIVHVCRIVVFVLVVL